MHWNTEVMKSLVQAGVPEATIEVNSQGGDYDTETLRVSQEGAEAVVFGMNTALDVDITSPADTDCELLFVTFSERSGMTNADAKDMRLVSYIKEALQDAGLPSTQEGYKAFC